MKQTVIQNLLNEKSLEELFKYGRIDNLILPYIWLSRSPKKMEKLVKELFLIANRIISVDLHTEIVEIINIKMGKFWISSIPKDILLIAPDKGAENRNQNINFDVKLTKKRNKNKINISTDFDISVVITGKDCAIIDDIIDTGKTVLSAADYLFENGAKSVHLYATHAVLSKNAKELLEKSKITSISVTDTIPNDNLTKKFTVLPMVKSLENITF